MYKVGLGEGKDGRVGERVVAGGGGGGLSSSAVIQRA